jgi:hypothetical protein
MRYNAVFLGDDQPFCGFPIDKCLLFFFQELMEIGHQYLVDATLFGSTKQQQALFLIVAMKKAA